MRGRSEPGHSDVEWGTRDRPKLGLAVVVRVAVRVMVQVVALRV